MDSSRDRLAPYTLDLAMGVRTAIPFAVAALIAAVLIDRPYFVWNYFSALAITLMGFGLIFVTMLRYLRPSRWKDRDEVAPMPATVQRMERAELRKWRLRQLLWVVPVLALGVATLDASAAGGMTGLALLGFGWLRLLRRYEEETGARLYYLPRKRWAWKPVKPRYFVDPASAYERVPPRGG